MGIKRCKECGEEVSSSAKACPKCGKDQRNFFKKHPIISVIGIVIILGVILGAGGSSQSEPKNTLNNGTNTDNTQTPVKTEFVVGEIYEDESIAIKFVSKNNNFTNYSKYADVKKGYKVIEAVFEVENVGVSDLFVSTLDFECYADGYACNEFYYVDETLSATLSAGKKTKGKIYFEVPKDAKEVYLEYETDFWNDEKIKFII